MFDFFKKRFSKKPWCKTILDVNGNEVVVDCNKAYEQELTAKNIQIEITKQIEEDEKNPKLTQIHWGIDKAGRIGMEFSWNQAFIQMLESNGFLGSTDEEVIQQYLKSIASDNIGVTGEFDTASSDADEFIETFANSSTKKQRILPK